MPPRPARRPACRCSPCAVRLDAAGWRPLDRGGRPWQSAVQALGRRCPAAFSSPSAGSNSRLSPLRRSTLSRAHHRAHRRCAARAERDRHPRPRGPFDEAAEARADGARTHRDAGDQELRRRRDLRKIAAARALGLPVIIVSRPAKPRRMSRRSRRRCGSRMARRLTAAPHRTAACRHKAPRSRPLDQPRGARADDHQRRHVGHGSSPRSAEWQNPDASRPARPTARAKMTGVSAAADRG